MNGYKDGKAVQTNKQKIQMGHGLLMRAGRTFKREHSLSRAFPSLRSNPFRSFGFGQPALSFHQVRKRDSGRDPAKAMSGTSAMHTKCLNLECHIVE